MPGEVKPIRDEDAMRGQVAPARNTSGAVHLFRAERIGAGGCEESFCWAEGWALFTPRQFTMSLQWTKAAGTGGSEVVTCAGRY